MFPHNHVLPIETLFRHAHVSWINRRLSQAELRAGSVYISGQIVRFLGPTLNKCRVRTPWVTLLIRGQWGVPVFKKI